ncbi:MAG: hypothetical protein PSV13_02600, partial [Lacunisphaera sp.]|nr:hypothetical protein [Lacunisphaera sp.]
VCALWATESRGRRAVRWLYLLLVITLVVAGPLQSFNRDPAALLAAVRDRDALETSAYPVVGEVRSCLRRLVRDLPAVRIFLVVHDESVVLPLLADRNLRVLPVRRPVLLRLAAAGRLVPGDLVVTEAPDDLPGLDRVAEVSAPSVYSADWIITQYVYRVNGRLAPVPLWRPSR